MSEYASTGVTDGQLRLRLLTVGEVAEILGIAPRTVWRMLSREQIPKALKVGGSTRWEERDIRDWIAQGCPEQNGSSPPIRKGSANGIRL